MTPTHPARLRALLPTLALCLTATAASPADRIPLSEVLGTYEGTGTSGITSRTYDATLELTQVAGRQIQGVLTMTGPDGPYASGTLQGRYFSPGFLRIQGRVDLLGKSRRGIVQAIYFRQEGGGRRLNGTFFFKGRGDRGTLRLNAEPLPEE